MLAAQPALSSCDCLTVASLAREALAALADRYQLRIAHVADQDSIPHSYWGEPEAGINGSVIFVRTDTPLHSLLHEMSHVICMDPARRAVLERDAGSDDAEEAAVCYLQIVLADELAGAGRTRLMQDMDSWGYSFRLGSTSHWFREDAADARDWLIRHKLLMPCGVPTYTLRQR